MTIKTEWNRNLGAKTTDQHNCIRHFLKQVLFLANRNSSGLRLGRSRRLTLSAAILAVGLHINIHGQGLIGDLLYHHNNITDVCSVVKPQQQKQTSVVGFVAIHHQVYTHTPEVLCLATHVVLVHRAISKAKQSLQREEEVRLDSSGLLLLRPEETAAPTDWDGYSDRVCI